MNASTRGSEVRVIRKVVGHIAAAAMIAFFLIGCFDTVIQQIAALFQLNEIGYGDTYVLYDVVRFQQTGEIYRDLSQPPYLPAQYSPLMYMLYSLPGRIYRFANPYLGPRLVALAAFLLCVATTVSIAHSLIPARRTWWWTLLIVGSMNVMRDWILQLRGDFLGAFFSLLTVRLLFIESWWAIVLAGLCAGFATQFKITFVAALAAGTLWLLIRRRWRQAGGFAAAAVLTSVGLYLLLWTREHRMLTEMMAMSPGIYEVRGYLKLAYHLMSEPAVLLAAIALSPVAWRSNSRWTALLLFGGLSVCVAAVTDLQAGGNVNYFYEALFALAPLAVLGARRLLARARLNIGAGLFVTALFAFHLLPPLRQNLSENIQYAIGPGGVKLNNREFGKIQDVLRGRHVFSSVPSVALLDPQPALMDPFLLGYLQRVGKFDPKPIFERIRNSEFDIVVTASTPQVWRGILHVGPELRGTISASYQPYCVYSKYLFHLPRNQSGKSTLAKELLEIGCQPVACNRPSICPAW